MDNGYWHFPRTELAETFYRALALGPTKAISMFGPRQIGKTEFLTKDLAPLAEKRGHKVVFADFWGDNYDPLAVLLHALDQTFRTGSFAERLKRILAGMSPKIKLKSPDGSFEVEINTSGLWTGLPSNLLFLLDEYCEQLANEKCPTFLLLDEFQEVCKRPFGAELVAALRSSLNRRRYGFGVVFCGSSQDELRTMFTDRAAPFFAYANNFDFPPLDVEFVDYLVNQYRTIMQSDVDRDDALTVFKRFHNNPMILHRWLGQLVLDPNLNGVDAITKTLVDVAEHFGYRRTWEKIKPDERIAARLLADDLSIYNDHGERNSNELTGRRGLTSDKLVAAVNELSTLGIAEKRDGSWIIGDNLFKGWISNRPKSEF